MTQMPPWSYTALTKYETCPHQYYKVRVEKSVTEPQGEAAMWGDRVHKALEESVKTGAPLPEGMEQWQKHTDKFREAWKKEGTVVFTEKQLAVSKFLTPVDWKSPDAWCRGIVDIGVLRGDTLLAMDWKTGKRKQDSSQLELFAALLFLYFPFVTKIRTAFLWLAEGKTDGQDYKPEDTQEIWRKFMGRVNKMKESYETNTWEKRPSGLCRGWCHVKTCDYWKPKKEG